MKLGIRHDAVSVWITLSTVTFRQRAAMTWGLTGLLSLALATSLSACSVRPSSSTQRSSSGHASATSIMVFAAMPLRPVFAQLAGKFQTENPGATVDFDFGTSSELANKLTQGAVADIFASADSAQMDTVAKADLTGSDPVNFASNTLVIVTAPGDPKHIHSFADLTKPGLQVSACQSQVPCGAAAQRIEDDSRVHLSPTSEESTVSEVLAKVTNGCAQGRRQGEHRQVPRIRRRGKCVSDRDSQTRFSARTGAEICRPGDRRNGPAGAQPSRLRQSVRMQTRPVVTRPAGVALADRRRRHAHSTTTPVNCGYASHPVLEVGNKPITTSLLDTCVTAVTR